MRRLFAMLAISALVVGAVPAPAAVAATGTCRVRNTTTGARYVGTGANLQVAIDGASSGDTLKIVGSCIGTFTIASEDSSYELSLQGVPTDRFPVPKLDAQRRGRVLSIRRATVTVADLRITGGAHVSRGWGGGIWVNRGDLTLAGTARVAGNRAWYGGGLFSYRSEVILDDGAAVARNRGGGVRLNGGTVTLLGSARVVGNEGYSGAGIENNYGALVVGGSASVRRNVGEEDGGGIYLYQGATLSMDADASVTGNVARRGGGIFLRTATVHLSGAARVTGNVAKTIGGGILVGSGKVYVCSVDVAIAPNDPDDPPATLPCP